MIEGAQMSHPTGRWREAARTAAGIGIDFGTTNSVVAFAAANGDVTAMTWPTQAGPTDTFRTALMLWRDGARVRHVAGPSAIARAVEPPCDQRFVQSIKTHLASRVFSETRLYGKKFTLENLVSAFLTHLLSDAGGLAKTRASVVSGRPVVFAGNDPDEALGVARLAAAYGEAGVEGVAFAYEPLGAAYWYARDLTREETVLVADFGGGTSDFSVLRFERGNHGLNALPLAHGGVGIAGDTFDYRIIDRLIAPHLGKGAHYRSLGKTLPLPAFYHASFAQWHQLSWLKSAKVLDELRSFASASAAREEIERLVAIIEFDLGFELYQAVGRLKADLSVSDRADFAFDREGVKIFATATRADFEHWIARDLHAIARTMDDTLSDAGMRASDIDAVFVTGGTSYVPAVRALFASRFDAARLHFGHAFQSVASGLALYAADRDRIGLRVSRMGGM